MSFFPVEKKEITNSVVSEWRTTVEHIKEGDESEESDDDKAKAKEKDAKKDATPEPAQKPSEEASGACSKAAGEGSGLMALFRQKMKEGAIASPAPASGGGSDGALDAPIDSPIKVRKTSVKLNNPSSLQQGSTGGDANDASKVKAGSSPSTMSVLQSVMRRDSKSKVMPMNEVGTPDSSSADRERRVSFNIEGGASAAALANAVMTASPRQGTPSPLALPEKLASGGGSGDDKDKHSDDSLDGASNSPSPSARTIDPSDGNQSDVSLVDVDDSAAGATNKSKAGRSFSLGNKSTSIKDILKDTQQNEADFEVVPLAEWARNKRAHSDSSRSLLARESASAGVNQLTTIPSTSSQVGDNSGQSSNSNNNKSWV
jgi:hypothetical protein